MQIVVVNFAMLCVGQFFKIFVKKLFGSDGNTQFDEDFPEFKLRGMTNTRFAAKKCMKC